MTVTAKQKKPKSAKKPKKVKPPARTWVQLPPFDMMAKPCVPVAMLGEHGPRVMSFGDILEKSANVAAVLVPSPSSWLGTMRALSGCAQRVAAPKDAAARAELLRKGFDAKAMRLYVEESIKKGWFDLFDANHPLYQVDPALLSDPVSDMSFARQVHNSANEHSVAKLMFEPAGVTKTMFGKTFDDDPPQLSSAEAGLALLGYQACGMGGSNGGLLDGEVDANKFVTYANGPGSAGGTSFLLLGDSLGETLALQTLTDEFARQVRSETATGHDVLSWERPTEGRAIWDEINAGCRGPLDFLSLVNKRVSLLAKLDANGKPVLGPDGHALIVGTPIRQGRGGTVSGKTRCKPVLNPWYAYTTNKKGEPYPIGRFDRTHEPVWLTALRGLGADRRPLAIEQAAKLGYERKTLRLRLVGVYHEPGKSNVAFTENEEVEFPVELLDAGRVRRTVEALDRARMFVVGKIANLNLMVDHAGNKHKNHKTAASMSARTDIAVTRFWDMVREHAILGAVGDLSEDANWVKKLKGIAFKAMVYNENRRDRSSDTIMRIAKASVIFDKK